MAVGVTNGAGRLNDLVVIADHGILSFFTVREKVSGKIGRICRHHPILSIAQSK